MPGLDRDAFRKLTGRTLDSLKPHESLARISSAVRAQLTSDYPVRPIGSTADTFTYMTEEQRASHVHILGTTREGKSKLIELMVRQDIDHGYGATVLDPSDGGQTVKDILRYCAQVGYRKVVYIDPHDHYACLPTINPLRVPLNREGNPYAADADAKVENVMESIRLLWGSRDFSDTAIIQANLTALLTVLVKARCTLPDAFYFASRGTPWVDARRAEILERVRNVYRYDQSLQSIENIFRKPPTSFDRDFGSTARRMKPFFTYLPSLMYGSTTDTLDYVKLVREKWVVLVNLYRGNVWGVPQQRTLGTLVIAELINAIRYLSDRTPWRGRHYLYIDEAGQYATRLLADTMAYSGKSGLWVTVAHQFYRQFEDEKVLDAVENLCKVKVMFHVPNAADRSRMLRDLFSGSIPENLNHWLSVLQKQQAIVKIQKNEPQVVTIADVPAASATDEQLQAFKDSIYASNDFYRTKAAVESEIKNRFVRPQGEQVQDLRAAGKRAEPEPAAQQKEEKRDEGQDTQGAVGGPLVDSLPDSEAPLRPAVRRKPAGKPPAKPKAR